MHTSVLNWFTTSLPAGAVAGRRVLEIGSYNVNGTVRPIVEAHGPVSYVGVDQQAGPGVDQVVPCAELVSRFGCDSFDVVIATELLEHVVDWRDCVAQMVEVLAPCGLLAVTTRSPGFPYHPFPVDTWRYTTETMRRIVKACRLRPVELQPDPDPRSPGVFAMAVKPRDWQAPWSLNVETHRVDPVGLAAVFRAAIPEPVVAP